MTDSTKSEKPPLPKFGRECFEVATRVADGCGATLIQSALLSLTAAILDERHTAAAAPADTDERWNVYARRGGSDMNWSLYDGPFSETTAVKRACNLEYVHPTWAFKALEVGQEKSPPITAKPFFEGLAEHQREGRIGYPPACYCSDITSGGVPCPPGTCPNVPAPIAGNVYTEQASDKRNTSETVHTCQLAATTTGADCARCKVLGIDRFTVEPSTEPEGRNHPSDAGRRWAEGAPPEPAPGSREGQGFRAGAVRCKCAEPNPSSMGPWCRACGQWLPEATPIAEPPAEPARWADEASEPLISFRYEVSAFFESINQRVVVAHSTEAAKARACADYLETLDGVSFAQVRNESEPALGSREGAAEPCRSSVGASGGTYGCHLRAGHAGPHRIHVEPAPIAEPPVEPPTKRGELDGETAWRGLPLDIASLFQRRGFIAGYNHALVDVEIADNDDKADAAPSEPPAPEAATCGGCGRTDCPMLRRGDGALARAECHQYQCEHQLALLAAAHDEALARVEQLKEELNAAQNAEGRVVAQLEAVRGHVTNANLERDAALSANASLAEARDTALAKVAELQRRLEQAEDDASPGCHLCGRNGDEAPCTEHLCEDCALRWRADLRRAEEARNRAIKERDEALAKVEGLKGELATTKRAKSDTLYEWEQLQKTLTAATSRAEAAEGRVAELERERPHLLEGARLLMLPTLAPVRELDPWVTAERERLAELPWDEGGRDAYYSMLAGDDRLVAGLDPPAPQELGSEGKQ